MSRTTNRRRRITRRTRATAQPPAGLGATPVLESTPAAADITLTGQRHTLTTRMFDSTGRTYRLDEELPARAAIHHARPVAEYAAAAMAERERLEQAIWELRDTLGWEKCDELLSMVNGLALALHEGFAARLYDLARAYTVADAPVGVVVFADEGPARDATLG